VKSASTHFLHHVPVTNIRFVAAHTVRLEGLIEAEITHDCRNNRMLTKETFVVHILRTNKYNLIPVNELSFFFYSDVTITIGIKSEVDIGFLFQNNIQSVW